jgi:hypothetical protein
MEIQLVKMMWYLVAEARNDPELMRFLELQLNEIIKALNWKKTIEASIYN